MSNLGLYQWITTQSKIIALGATICETYAAGVSKSTMLDFIRETYDTTRRQLDAAKLMGASVSAYCPQFANK